MQIAEFVSVKYGKTIDILLWVWVWCVESYEHRCLSYDPKTTERPQKEKIHTQNVDDKYSTCWFGCWLFAGTFLLNIYSNHLEHNIRRSEKTGETVNTDLAVDLNFGDDEKKIVRTALEHFLEYLIFRCDLA